MKMKKKTFNDGICNPEILSAHCSNKIRVIYFQQIKSLFSPESPRGCIHYVHIRPRLVHSSERLKPGFLSLLFLLHSSFPFIDLLIQDQLNSSLSTNYLIGNNISRAWCFEACFQYLFKNRLGNISILKASK